MNQIPAIIKLSRLNPSTILIPTTTNIMPHAQKVSARNLSRLILQKGPKGFKSLSKLKQFSETVLPCGLPDFFIDLE